MIIAIVNRLFCFKKFVLASLCLLGLSAHASPELTQVLGKYTKASSVEVSLKKTDEKNALGTKTSSEGLLKFSKNKIYILLNGDKKIEFYYKANKIWLVEYPDLDFDKNGKRKVTILTKSTPVLLKGLINLFSNQKKFLKEFKIVKELKDQDNLIVELKPSEKNLKSFSLIINTKERSINQVTFVDDVDTKTTLELSHLKLNRKMTAADFQFKSQKTDEVIPE